MKQISHKFLLALLICPFFATAQKWDYQWPMGYY